MVGYKLIHFKSGHPWLHTWKDLLKEEQDFPYSAGTQQFIIASITIIDVNLRALIIIIIIIIIINIIITMNLKVHNVPADVTSVRLRIALYTNENASAVPHHHVHKVYNLVSLFLGHLS